MNSDLKSISALKVLRLLAQTRPRDWTARELASHLELHPRSVQRYLAELTGYGVLDREGHRVRLVRRAS